MYVDLVERAAKAMAEADLWPGAWDGNMPHGYAMHDAGKNLWDVRAEAALAAVAPLIAAGEREALWRDMPPSADEDNKDHAEWARGFNFCLDHLKAVIRAREEVKWLTV